MAQLDVSEALTDPAFNSAFVVLRRTETVDDDGKSVVSLLQLPAQGVVSGGPDDSLIQDPDDEHQERSLAIVTRFPLRGVAPGYKPDQVLFRGNTYEVVKLDDYGAFGSGFVQVELRSTRNVDEAPETLPAPTGEMVFVAAPNSMMIGAL